MLWCDLNRLPLAKMNEILQKYLGTVVTETNGNGLSSLTYREKTDCYYSALSDCNAKVEFTVTDVKTNEDGAYQIFYHVDDYSYENYVLALMPNGDGSYQILSHLLA